ncbi:MAG: hypothetical protein PUB12_00465 [[Clostridium] aminophilum]|nr:hypothetical protein [[Clostridium] aminophilum]
MGKVRKDHSGKREYGLPDGAYVRVETGTENVAEIEITEKKIQKIKKLQEDKV